MRNSILWKLFSAFSLITILAVFVLNFFVSLRLRDQFEQKVTEKLQSNAISVGQVIRGELMEGDISQVSREVHTLAEKLDLRITVVDPNGDVLADSEESPGNMDSHDDRSEIIAALENGFGRSSRSSETLGYKMQYVAVRIEDGDQMLGVVRFAVPLSDVQLEIRMIYRIVLIGAGITLLIALTASYFISKSITSPIKDMTDTARKIATGDFSKKARSGRRDELGELADSLNAMSDELQQKMENLRKMDKMRTDFVANVSHELKTPLTLICGYIETLQDRALNDPEMAPRFIAIVKDHCDRLCNIIDDLLSLSELELSTESINASTFDLASLAEDVTLGFGHALDGKDQTLRIDTIGENFEITADAEKIEQLLANLVDNSIKYTGRAGKIRITIEDRNDSIHIAVEDNGIGIPEQDIDRVFERFYRVDKARSREAGGTGLGLGIAKHIVLAHGGSIRLESRVKRGTTVHVTLPTGR